MVFPQSTEQLVVEDFLQQNVLLLLEHLAASPCSLSQWQSLKDHSSWVGDPCGRAPWWRGTARLICEAVTLTGVGLSACWLELMPSLDICDWGILAEGPAADEFQELGVAWELGKLSRDKDRKTD